MSRLGIDFGTTKTVVSFSNPHTGEIIILPIGRSGNAIPTLVHLDEDGKFSYGDDAEDKLPTDAIGICEKFKLSLGTTSPVLCRELKDGSWKPVNAKTVTEFFLTHVLELAKKALTKYVPSKIGQGFISEFVFTHPVSGNEGTAWYSDFNVAATNALKNARFSGDVSFLPESIAAGKAYLNVKPKSFNDRALILDWGGGTLDLAIVKRSFYDDFVVENESLVGKDPFGGEKIDALLLTQVINILEKQMGEKPFDANDPVKRLKMLREAKAVKEKLSTNDIWKFFYQGWKNLAFSREAFNQLIDHLIDEIIGLIREVFAKCSTVDTILLVGGSSQIPYLKERLENEFSKIQIAQWGDASHAVVLGALSPQVWEPGAPHPYFPGKKIIAAPEVGKWHLSEPGYILIEAQGTHKPRLKWSPGKEHPDFPNCIANSNEGQWEPAPGYDWIDKVSGSYKTKWSPGKEHPDFTNCIANSNEGQWDPAPGYVWVNPTDADDYTTKWSPGKKHRDYAHCIASQREGVWEGEAGWKLKDPYHPEKGVEVINDATLNDNKKTSSSNRSVCNHCGSTLEKNEIFCQTCEQIVLPFVAAHNVTYPHQHGIAGKLVLTNKKLYFSPRYNACHNLFSLLTSMEEIRDSRHVMNVSDIVHVYKKEGFIGIKYIILLKDKRVFEYYAGNQIMHQEEADSFLEALETCLAKR